MKVTSAGAGVVSLLGSALRLRGRRPPARHRVAAQERQPVPRAAHRAAQPIPADRPHVRVLPPRHRRDEQPAVEPAPVPRPAVSRLPVEAHGERTYDDTPACTSCRSPLAGVTAHAGRDRCAVCRAMGWDGGRPDEETAS